MSTTLTRHSHPANPVGVPPTPPEGSPKSNVAAGQGQLGFGFLDEAQPVLQFDMPAGTWDRREFSKAHFEELLTRAEAALQVLAGPARPVFQAGIAWARAWVAGSRHTVETFSLPCQAFQIEPEALQAFVEHCRAFRDWQAHGIRYKVREGGRSADFGMAVEGVGSVVVSCYDNGRLAGSYLPYDDDFFLQSYLDGEQTHELPYKVWGAAISCQKVVEAKGTPNIGSFPFKGREYTCMGASYGSLQSGWCWLVVAASEWNGPTYTYRELCQSWDDGRRQRGDERGMLVKVRGQLCVLHSPAYFIDRNPQPAFVALEGDEDDAGSADEADSWDDLQEDDE